MRRVLAGRGDRGGFPDHVADSPCKMRREVCGLWCWPSIEPLDVELLLLELLTLLDPRLLQPSALLPVKVAVDDDVLRWLTSPAKERLRASTPPGGGSGERRAFNLSPSDMSWLATSTTLPTLGNLRCLFRSLRSISASHIQRTSCRSNRTHRTTHEHRTVVTRPTTTAADRFSRPDTGTPALRTGASCVDRGIYRSLIEDNLSAPRRRKIKADYRCTRAGAVSR